jgi:hypothetical protein
VVATLLGGLASGDGANHANRASGNSSAFASYDTASGIRFHVGELSFGLSPDTWPSAPALWGAALGLITVFVIAYALVILLIGGAVELGLCNYNVNLVQGRAPSAPCLAAFPFSGGHSCSGL